MFTTNLLFVITGTTLLFSGLAVLGTAAAAYFGPKIADSVKNIVEDVKDEIGHNKSNYAYETKTEESATEKVEESQLGNQEPQEPQDEEEKPTPIPPIGTENEIKDETNTNIEQSIGNFADIEQLKALRNEQWAREDELTRQLWKREDTAWQRTVADMQKAGVNPNLVGASATSTSQPIQTSTGIDYSAYIKELDKQIELLKQELDQDYKKDENWKDRIWGLIENITGLAGSYFVYKGLKSK